MASVISGDEELAYVVDCIQGRISIETIKIVLNCYYSYDLSINSNPEIYYAIIHDKTGATFDQIEEIFDAQVKFLESKDLIEIVDSMESIDSMNECTNCYF